MKPRATYCSYLVLLGFTLVLLWPLCMGRALYWGDILLYFAPMYRYEQSTLRHGHIPLWNPAINEGQPFVGNPQMGVFYPATVLLSFMPVWMCLSVLTIAHVFLCGAFMTAYLKRWTTQNWSALAGGLVYMGGECLIGRLQFPPMIFTAAYFPLLLLSIDRFLDAPSQWRRLAALLQIALVVGCMVLAAHPQMAYLILAFGCLYSLARLTRPRPVMASPNSLSSNSSSSNWRVNLFAVRSKAAGMLLACGLGVMLAAVQILPAVQLMLESPREQLTPMQANRFTLEPAHLLTLIFPRFWGHPATADFWGGGNAWEPAFFIGWLPLLFIGIACVRRYRWRRTQFWVAAVLLSIWMAFGSFGGLYWVAFKLVPGLSNFHDPARFLVYATFAFAVLTAFGCDISEEGRHASVPFPPARLYRLNRVYIRLFCLLSIAIPLWWHGRDWNPTAPHAFLEGHPQDLFIKSDVNANNPANNANNHVSQAQGKGALAVDPQRTYQPDLELFWKHYVTDGYSDYRASNAVSLQAALNTRMPNLDMTEGPNSASGYEPVPMSAPAALDHLGRVACWRGEPNLSRLMALMGASTLILPGVTRPHDPRFAPPDSPSRYPVIALANRDVLASAWIARRIRHVEGKTRISAALAAPDFRPDEVALLCDSLRSDELTLEWPSSQWNREKKRGERGEGRVVPLFSDAHTIELDVDAGSEPGLLVIAAAAFPGWTATVDGKHAAIHRTDGALMGLFLSPGAHHVLLKYQPVSYRFGLYLSLFACGVMCAGAGLLLSLPAGTKRVLFSNVFNSNVFNSNNAASNNFQQ